MINLEQEKNAKSKIIQCLGKPFINGGRDIRGFDCWGFVISVYDAMNIKVRDFNYDHDLIGMFKELNKDENYSDWEEIEKPEHLCVCIIGKSKRATHAGIWTREGIIFHAAHNHGIIGQKEQELKFQGDTYIKYYRLKSNA